MSGMANQHTTLSPAQRASPGVLGDHTNLRSLKGDVEGLQSASKRRVVSDAAEGRRGPAGVQGLDTDQPVLKDLQPRSVQRLGKLDRKADRVAYIEDRVLDFAQAVECTHKLTFKDSLRKVSQDPCWYVGRICCSSGRRLSAQDVLLEGSIKHSQGHRMVLDISRLEEYRLFPGQIVAVEGLNSDGRRLTASKIITSALPDPPANAEQCPATPPSEEPASGESCVSIVVAAGPYTQTHDLEYQPLDDLLEQCAQNKPDLLLLLGPFVDADHELVKGGAATSTFERIFQEQVLERLERSSAAGHVAIVPCSRDADHPTELPQAAFDFESGPGLSLLGNPATFSFRGLTVGAITADVLKHLSSQSVEQTRSGSSSRMVALASQLLLQNSYYPMFPPAGDTVLDMRSGRDLRLPEVPDVLVLPSDLVSFTKSLSATRARSTVCVNPGRLMRGGSKGSYAALECKALRVSPSAEQANQPSRRSYQTEIRAL